MTDFSTTFAVAQSPPDVFAAINDVRSWWAGEISGATAELGDEFSYRHADVHRSTQRVVELVPDRRVVWLVTESRLGFTADAAEWDRTRIEFELTPVAEGTEVRFTHIGLRPSLECYADCSAAWTHYIAAALRSRIAGELVPEWS